MSNHLHSVSYLNSELLCMVSVHKQTGHCVFNGLTCAVLYVVQCRCTEKQIDVSGGQCYVLLLSSVAFIFAALVHMSLCE